MSKQPHKHKSRRFRRFLWANDAVSALEYALVVGIIAVAVGVGIAFLGGKVEKAIKRVGTQVGNVTTPTIPSAPSPF